MNFDDNHSSGEFVTTGLGSRTGKKYSIIVLKLNKINIRIVRIIVNFI